MTARSPGAFFLSAFLHTAVATMVLAFAWFAQKRASEQSPIFQLVVGPGNNYGATIAAAGSAASRASSPATLLDKMNRALNRSEQNVLKTEAAQEKLEQLQADKEAKQAINAKADKLASPAPTPKSVKTPTQKSPAPSTTHSTNAKPSPVKVPRINAEDIANGVLNASPTELGAGGSARSRPEGDLSEAYIAWLRQQLRDAFQPPDGMSDRLQAEVEFILNADGSVTGAHVIGPSGNTAFDRAVLAAFRTMAALPPPPTNRSARYTLSFRMHDAT